MKARSNGKLRQNRVQLEILGKYIANLFNSFAASGFAHNTPSPPPPSPAPSSGSAANAPASPDMSELTLTVSEDQSVLEALYVTKATGSDKIPAKLL